jgi:hypothetical protein
MLKLNIKKHCDLRNYPDTAAFLSTQGFSHWLSNKYAAHEVESISFDDMERLCNIFRCTPNDLFEWTPADSNADTSGHPLAPLRTGQAVNLKIKSLSYEQLKEIANIVNGKK